MEQEKDKPARIVRPGAETKVGGSPITTIGFKLFDDVLRLLWLLLMLLSTSKEEEEEEREVLLRGWEDGESGIVEFIHRDAIVLILWYANMLLLCSHLLWENNEKI